MPAPRKKMSGSGAKRTAREQTLFGEQVNPADLARESNRTLHDTERFRTKYIPTESLVDNTENRFKITDTSFLEASMEKLGQLQPLIVMQKESEKGIVYEIKAGSRRLKALRDLKSRALRKEDAKAAEKFGRAFCIVLPDGASRDEIEAVITETNTTARVLTISEIFMNFDVIFARDSDGNYRYLPKGKNKYESASGLLKSMGFTFSPSSVKQYLSIYTAHNQNIRKRFESGALTKRQALAISRMPPVRQDDVMSRAEAMSPEEITRYIRDYADEKKDGGSGRREKGTGALEKIEKARKQMARIAEAEGIDFADELQRSRALSGLEELKEAVEAAEKKVRESEPRGEEERQ